MLLPALLASAALLSLALAACPCPPAPAAAKVCGSDHKTYPSACDLTCTAPTGVTAAHPGPCRPAIDSILAPVLNDSLTTASRKRRSPKEPVTWEQYMNCCNQREDYSSYSVCQSSADHFKFYEEKTAYRVKRKCRCLGFNSDADTVNDFEQWDLCKKLTCYDAAKSCWQSCRHGSRKFQDCRNSCFLQGLRCSCECLMLSTDPQDTGEEAEEAAPLARSSSLDSDEEVTLAAAAPRPAAPAAPAVLLVAAALLKAW